MKFVAADDECLALNLLVRSIEEAQPNAEIKSFLYQSELVDEIDGGFAPDVAFLDIEMPGMSGMELAKYIKQKASDTDIIFVTGYPEYALEAFRMHAREYISKPVSTAKVREELNLLQKAPLPYAPTSRVQVQCFGNFEVFVDGEPVRFKYSKTKELFAYLIDRRGALCDNGELTTILWGDDAQDKSYSYLRNLRSDMLATFEKAGCADIIIRQKKNLAVVPEKVDCDYYRWTNGDPAALSAYRGEYMTQFSWSEFSLGAIENSR